MSQEEFMRRWEELPDVKSAELIDGIVYVPPLVIRDQGAAWSVICCWLTQYSWNTAVTEAGSKATWLMLDSVPQPDAFLLVRAEYGGQARVSGEYWAGTPDLIVELCITGTEVDFGPKLALYQRAGVREYITLEALGHRIVWRVLNNGSFVQIRPDGDGCYRSRVFPGLWLNATAVWKQDRALLTLLEQGLASPEHAAFIEQLQRAHHA